MDDVEGGALDPFANDLPRLAQLLARDLVEQPVPQRRADAAAVNRGIVRRPGDDRQPGAVFGSDRNRVGQRCPTGVGVLEEDENLTVDLDQFDGRSDPSSLGPVRRAAASRAKP